MLVDATIWEMTPAATGKPVLLAVVAGTKPACFWTWTTERGMAARRARRLITQLSPGRYGRMSAFATGVEVTRLLEDINDHALTCEPFITQVDYEPGEPALTTGTKLRKALGEHRAGSAH